MNLDSENTTIERIQIIKGKYFLYQTYNKFYKLIKNSLSKESLQGKVVELGSGGGFLKRIIPNVITSEVLKIPNVDKHFSALSMPFKKHSLNAIVMFDVFHHLPDSRKFLKEAERVLKKNGQIVMIEPSNTPFASFIYKYIHHEPYNSKGKWSFKSTGPLSGANLSQAWIVFVRDKEKFEIEFPNLKLESIEPINPISYILGGGFTFPQILPNSAYKWVNTVENILKPLNKFSGMFYLIKVKKIN